MKGLLATTLTLSFIFALPARAWWGKYSSYKQAREACHKWKKQGRTILFLEEYRDDSAYERKLKQLRDAHDYFTEKPFLNYSFIYERDALNFAYKKRVVKRSVRRCSRESATRQLLGETYDEQLNSKIVYETNPIDYYGSWRVKKHFRY